MRPLESAHTIRWPFASESRSDDGSSVELVPLSPVEHGEQIAPRKGSVQEQSRQIPPRTLKLWTPWPLKKIVLAGFAACFVLLAVVLAALFGVSEHNQGLASSKEKLHYLWTYGPTAVLTIVAALWGQVEYRTKQLMPWKTMANAPALAKDSIWMDYISPWNVAALVSSLRARHYPVSLAISGTLLLKLLIVISTGLLLLESTVLHNKNAQLLLTNKFDGSKFNPAAIDSRPFLNYYAAAGYGSDYLYGTSDQYAYQTFNLSGYADDAELQGEVDAFHADLSCEVLVKRAHFPLINNHSVQHIQVNSSTSATVNKRYIDLRTPNCHILFPSHLQGTDEVYFANCKGSPVLDWRNATRSWSPDGINNDLLLVTNDNTGAGTTAVYCRPNYGISRANLKVKVGASSNASIYVPPNSTSRKLVGVSNADILNGVRHAIIHLPNELAVADSGYSPGISSIYNAIDLNYEKNHEKEIDDEDGSYSVQSVSWTEADRLISEVQTMFRSVAPQVAKFRLLQSAHDPVDGKSTWRENRLQVRVLSFALMEAILVLLTAITLALFFNAPREVCPRDPGSISGIAVIAARNEDLLSQFRNTGHWGLDPLFSATAEQKFGTNITRNHSCSEGFTILKEGHASMDDHVKIESLQWWRPLSASWLFTVIYFIGPIGLIVALEVLWERSHRLNGFVEIDPNQWTQYAWVYLPAFVMFLLNTVFLMLDFGARVFQPYSVLSKQAVPAQISLMTQQLDKVALHSLWDSIRNSHLATAATSIAIIAGGLLPIAVSGLYTAETTARVDSVSIQQTGTFNTSKGQYDAQTSLGALVLNANLSYPQWTYKDLAFPTLDVLDGLTASSGNDSATVNVQTPAWRSRLNCTHFSQDIAYEHVNSIKELKAHRDHLDDPTLPKPSGIPGIRINITQNTVCDNKTHLFSWEMPYGYFGLMTEAENVFVTQELDCVEWVMFYGYANKTHPEASQAYMMSCESYIESVETNLTLKVPSYDIDTTNPPVVHNGTSKYQGVIDDSNYGDRFLTGMGTINPSTPYRKTFDGFVDAMVYGRNGVPPNQLLNATRLHARYQEVYGMIQAQRLGAQFRQNDSATHHFSNQWLPQLTGTLRDPNRIRLVQSTISTRLLEVLLGVMLLAAGTAVFAIDTRRTLPKNPCSIGAVISFLAGSEALLDESVVPVGAEWLGDRELARKGVFAGLLFSLGWWDEGMEKRFGIGVGQAKKL